MGGVQVMSHARVRSGLVVTLEIWTMGGLGLASLTQVTPGRRLKAQTFNWFLITFEGDLNMIAGPSAARNQHYSDELVQAL